MAAFNIEDVFEFLESDSNYSKSEKQKAFRSLFKNDDFKKWLFCPDDKDKKLTSNVSKLYEYLIKPKTMKLIMRMIDDEEYSFDRSIATLCYSISNIAKEAGVERINELVEKRKKGEISDKDYRIYKKEAEEYIEMAEDMTSVSKKIVKKKAKELSVLTKMPKKLCAIVLYNTPNPKFIDRYKIGFYLNNLLPQIYQFVDNEASSLFSVFTTDTDYKWNKFFKYVFGDDKLTEIATFILLEGVHRISQYNSSAVEECWNSLTDWALNQLEEAPDTLRDQMIELYIKRISKMFSNKSYDLRANLLKLSKAMFPNLVTSVDKYKDKIEAIMLKK